MAEITVTKHNFEREVLLSEKPVLLDFWASWCGPCKMLAPIVREIAQDYAGKIKVGKVNVDDEPELAADFQIASIPTVVLMQNGKVIRKSVGYRPKEDILRMIEG